MKDNNLTDILYTLIENWEDETIEFKGSAPGGHDVSRYVSALANEAFLHKQRCGWYIIGVDNKERTIVGTQYKNRAGELKELEADIYRKTGFEANPTFHELSVGGKRVLMLQVNAATPGHPVRSQGHAYGRSGDQLVALSKDKEDAIRFASGIFDWSAQIAWDADDSDLDPQAIRRARELYVAKNAHLKDDILQWSDEDFLQRLGLIIRGRYTNAALLLLGKPGSLDKAGIHGIEIRWILIDEKQNNRDYKHLLPPFLIASDEAFGLIRNTRVRYMSHRNIFPEEVQQYDEYSLRESINNAIAHTDYSSGECIDIVEYDNDKIVIRNAGTFLPGSIENVLSSTTPYSKYRNSVLCAAMVHLSLIDKVGSGIRTMFRHQIERLFPVPEYTFDDGHVQVMLQGKIINYDFAFNVRSNDLSPAEIALLYDVYKGRKIEKEGAALLRSKKLITGRYPNLAIAAFLGETANDQGLQNSIIQSRDMSTETYMAHIKDILRDGRSRSRGEILRALNPHLPKHLSYHTLETKLSNILNKMHKCGFIEISGERKHARWKLK